MELELDVDLASAKLKIARAREQHGAMASMHAYIKLMHYRI